MYSRYHDSSIVNMLIFAIGLGIVIPVAFGSLFWFVPFSGPACILAVLLLAACVYGECALEANLDVLYSFIPILAGIMIALLVYSAAGVPLVRGKFFPMPESRALNILDIGVTCVASAFLLVAGFMYFVRPLHDNLISLANSKLGLVNGTCDKEASTIGIATWMGSFVLFVFTRSATFDSLAFAVWKRMRRAKKIPTESTRLVDNAGTDPIEFGLPAASAPESKA